MKTVTIKGKKYPVNFGVGVLMAINDEMREKGQEMTEEDLNRRDIGYLAPMFYYSLEQGCWDKDIEMPIAREEARLALNGCMDEFLDAMEGGKLTEALVGKSGGGSGKPPGSKIKK